MKFLTYCPQTSLELLRHPTVRVGYHQLDASNKESLMAFCQHFKEQFESIDILINNAGNQRERGEGLGVHLFIPVDLLHLLKL